MTEEASGHLDKEEVRRKSDLITVVEDHVQKIRPSGDDSDQYVATCPFHDDENPSMSVHAIEGYYCHTCKEEGDIFNFVEKVKGLGFLGAMQYLAERFGIEGRVKGANTNASGPSVYVQREVMKEAVKYYQATLWQDPGAETARSYLVEDRGISEEVLREMKVGFVPYEDDDSFHRNAESVGKDEKKALQEAGIIKKGSYGYYERFKNRIVFPIRDRAGRPVGMAGRVLPEDASEYAKYKNTPETDLYKKNEVLYGAHVARKATVGSSGPDRIYVVEGYTDVLRLQMVGMKNVVGTAGTSFTDGHASLLESIAEKVVFLFDGDQAGLEASENAFRKSLSAGYTPFIAQLPEEMDPFDLVDYLDEKEGETKREVEHFIETRMRGFAEFFVGKAREEGKLNAPDGRADLEKEMASKIAAIEERSLRREYIWDTARELQVPPSEIFESVQAELEEEIEEGAREVYREMNVDLAKRLRKSERAEAKVRDKDKQESGQGAQEPASETSESQQVDASGAVSKEFPEVSVEVPGQEATSVEVAQKTWDAVEELIDEYPGAVEKLMVHMALSIGKAGLEAAKEHLPIRHLADGDAKDLFNEINRVSNRKPDWEGSPDLLSAGLRDKVDFIEKGDFKQSVTEHAGEIGLPEGLFEGRVEIAYRGVLGQWLHSYYSRKEEEADKMRKDAKEFSEVKRLTDKIYQCKDGRKQAKEILAHGLKAKQEAEVM